MEAVTGVFRSRDDARRAAMQLGQGPCDRDRISLLMPESSEDEIHAVRSSETEQPGVGGAFGGVLGGALGLVTGFELGVGVTALIPGVGPVLAIGASAAALFGIAGAVAGASVATAVDVQTTEGLPADEMFFYEDALRQGRSIVIVSAKDHDEAEWARKVLARSGAETVDAAREAWWIGLRHAEREHYRALGENFEQSEESYRAGFEAALRRELRGKSFVAGMDYLHDEFPGIWESDAFRKGFERGQIYLREREDGPSPH